MTSFNYSLKTTLWKKVWDQVFAIFKEKKFCKDATSPKKNLFFCGGLVRQEGKEWHAKLEPHKQLTFKSP